MRRTPLSARAHARVAVTVPLLGLLLAGTGTATASELPAKWGDGKTFAVKLSGSQVPGGGDPDAKGFALIRMNPKTETVCLGVAWAKVDGAVTAMHIHMGKAGTTGAHHIELLNDEHLAGGHNFFRTCVQGQKHEGMSAGDAIKEVIDDPSNFYLNIHSTAYEKGALRGQLD